MVKELPLRECTKFWGRAAERVDTREIGREVIEEVERKISKLSTPRGKSARPVLVYDGALAPVIETDGYFDALVPFRHLLGL